MIVAAIGTTLKHQDLIKVLRQEFANKYSYKIIGLGSNKTVIVSKSWFVGAQITTFKNELRVEGIIPSIITGILPALFLYIPLKNPWKRLEQKLALFLGQRYS